MTDAVKIAVAMTCHNRRNTTLACLRALFNSSGPDIASIDVYLVDDGSTDGSAQAIKTAYPNVTVLSGAGDLYWSRGTRAAVAEALTRPYDYFLLLNDDTTLYKDAVRTLVRTEQSIRASCGRPSIVTGSVQDPVTGSITYGGLRRASPWRPTRWNLVVPTDKPERVDTMNGNAVLIPREVIDRVGNLDERYVHGMGDLDYGLRAQRLGYAVYAGPYVGTCPRNSARGTFLDGSIGLRRRFHHLLSPKGLPPAQWWTFTRQHAGVAWPLYFGWPYIRVLLQSIGAAIRGRPRG